MCASRNCNTDSHLALCHSYLLHTTYPLGEWDFVYNDRKNRWLSELGMEDIKPRKRRSPGGDSPEYEKY
jgi:hypothetical protein